MLKRNFILLFFLAPLLAFAGMHPSDFEAVAKKYSGKHAVFLSRTKNLTLTYDSGKIAILVHNHIKKLILDEDAQAYANVSIDFDSFKKIDKISATLYNPVKNHYKKIEIGKDAVKTGADYGSGIFYGDNQSKSIVFPKVKKYSVVVVDYTVTLTNPHFLSAFIFERFMPTVKEKFTINYPLSMNVKYLLANNKNGKVKVQKLKNNNLQTLSFSTQNVDAYDIEDNAPDLTYYVPHVLAYIGTYEKDGKTVNLLNNVQGLYNWYYSLVKNIGKHPSAEIKSITDSLTKGVTDTATMIKNIYGWMQSQVKYVAFESGMGGFVPRSPNLVCERRYGDCKDMSALLYTMLNYAGINAHLTWIGTREIPYTYEQVPAPYVDNHMIVSVDYEGKTIFLDGTNKYVQFGLPSDNIQGKQALIGLGKGKYKLVDVPIMKASDNYQKDSTLVSYNDGKLTGTGEMIMGGSNKVDVAYNLAYSQDKIKKVIGEMVKKGSDKFQLLHYKISDINKRQQPIKINYSYDLPDYGSKINNKIYIDLNLNKPLPNEPIDTENRKYAYKYAYKKIISNTVKFKIPSHYVVDFLPRNESFKTNDFSYSIKYSNHDGFIVLKKSVTTNTLLLKKKDFNKANNFLQKLNNAYHQTVILKPEVQTKMERL